MKKILGFILFLGLFSSCSFWTANYNIPLTRVEKNSENCEVTLNMCEDTSYTFEDENILANWKVLSKAISLKLTNKSDYPIRINPDDIGYIDYMGRINRVSSNNQFYGDKYKIQPSLIIPSNTTWAINLIPTENWELKDISPILPGTITTHAIPNKKDLEIARSYVGKTLGIYVPVIIENERTDYLFEFTIDNWSNAPKDNKNKK